MNNQTREDYRRGSSNRSEQVKHNRNSFFDGGLFGNWIKWLVLSIITIGIYSFWVRIKLEDWKAKNTTFIN